MSNEMKIDAMTAGRMAEIRTQAAAMLIEAESWCHGDECSRDDRCEDPSDDTGCGLHEKDGCPPCICGIGELLQLRKSVESGIADLIAALEASQAVLEQARRREEQASKRAQTMVERAHEWRDVWIQTAERLGIQTGPETSGSDLTEAIVERVRKSDGMAREHNILVRENREQAARVAELEHDLSDAKALAAEHYAKAESAYARGLEHGARDAAARVAELEAKLSRLASSAALGPIPFMLDGSPQSAELRLRLEFAEQALKPSAPPEQASTIQDPKP